MSFVDAAESVANTLKLVVFFFGAWRFAWQDDSAYRKHLNHLDKFKVLGENYEKWRSILI